MGCSTGNLVIDDDESLHAVFAIAATQNLLVAVHAEDEALINERKNTNLLAAKIILNIQTFVIWKWRQRCRKSHCFNQTYGTRLYILHASTADEIALITQAKKAALPVYAETTPHHLFLSDASYATLQGKAVVNPPLRSESHQQVLWSALRDGIIDTIGSDHAPHTTAEKDRPYGECPSGMPGIETTLPLLLNAHHQGMLSLERILELTASKPSEIFHLPANEDVVLVDLEKTAR